LGSGRPLKNDSKSTNLSDRLSEIRVLVSELFQTGDPQQWAWLEDNLCGRDPEVLRALLSMAEDEGFSAELRSFAAALIGQGQWKQAPVLLVSLLRNSDCDKVRLSAAHWLRRWGHKKEVKEALHLAAKQDPSLNVRIRATQSLRWPSRNESRTAK
jgi:HEAT repeat protein